MFNVNQHIHKHIINEYRGSELKEAVILDDGKQYMIKKPDPIREWSKIDNLSYINNVFSEYIGCHIAQMIGLTAQNTILGTYTTTARSGKQKTKVVCLCEDVRNNGEKMHEFDTIALSTDSNSKDITFPLVEDIILHIGDVLNLDTATIQDIRNFYYEVFVLDAFIGNTDRHNGNLAILTQHDEFSRICPVFDCGSSMLPLLSDKELEQNKAQNCILSVYSVIRDEKGRRIQYSDYFKTQSNPSVDKAVKKIIPNINLKEIYNFIRNIDYITPERKQFYCDYLQTRYEKILIPALERIFPIKAQIEPDSIDLFQVYKRIIQPIAKLPLFEQTDMNINGKQIQIMKVSNKYAIMLDNEGICAGLLPIRSNNNEVRRAIQVLQANNIGYNFQTRQAPEEYEEELV